MQIADGSAPEDQHYLDLALVAHADEGRIELLVPGAEARQRWSEEN
jgi:hypothetical protein